MSKYLLVLNFIFIALLGSLPAAWAQQEPKEIVVGIIPGGDKDATRKAIVELAAELQKEIKIPVAVYISKNYSSMITAIKEKRVDFAFITAMGFVASEKEASLKVLLKKVWTEPYYFSTIYGDSKKGIRNLNGLKGKTIAFVDEKSTSGYLYPMLEFKKRGIKKEDFAKVVFSGSHAESVALLGKGEVDVVAVFSDDTKGKESAVEKYLKDDKRKKDMRLLWASAPIPNDPFVVRQDFYDRYPKLSHNVMFSLIDISERYKDKNNLREIMSEKGFLPATSRQYDAVREVLKQMDVKVD